MARKVGVSADCMERASKAKKPDEGSRDRQEEEDKVLLQPRKNLGTVGVDRSGADKSLRRATDAGVHKATGG